MRVGDWRSGQDGPKRPGHRAEDLHREATAGYGCGGGREDSTLQPGTDRGQDNQAQAREAFDVRRGKFNLLRRCALYASTLRTHPATRRELELRSSDSRENRASGSNPLQACLISVLELISTGLYYPLRLERSYVPSNPGKRRAILRGGNKIRHRELRIDKTLS
jgi:hypothetical protein